MEKVIVIEDRCSLCGLCLTLCPLNILVKDSDTIRTVDPGRCYYCGHCKAACPENALSFPEQDEQFFVPVLPAAEMHQPEALMLRFRSRRTTRQFLRKPLAEDLIDKVLQSGRYAPTGNNRQGIEYLILHSKSALDKFKKQAFETLAQLVDDLAGGRLTSQAPPVSPDIQARYAMMFNKKLSAWRNGEDRLFYNAPAVIFCHAHPDRALWPAWDAGLGAMQMVLMADALGLGSCFNGALLRAVYCSEPLREALPIPAAHEIPVCLMIGYPAVKFQRTVYRNPIVASWI